MSVAPMPHDVVRAMVVADYRPVEGSVVIVREKQVGDDAVLAVAFEDETGVQRRGLYGLRRDLDGAWRASGRVMGSVRPTDERDVWMTWGGWGGDSREKSVLGGWVAEASAVTARATDEVTGRTLDEAVENGVVLFVYEGFLRSVRADGSDGLKREDRKNRSAESSTLTLQEVGISDLVADERM